MSQFTEPIFRRRNDFVAKNQKNRSITTADLPETAPTMRGKDSFMEELKQEIMGENGIRYRLAGDYYLPMLKARDQMEWVRRINSIRSRAEEVVLRELVYI